MEELVLKDVINPDAVAVDVEAGNKEEAFQYATEMLYRSGVLTSMEDFKKDLYLREAEGQTGIGNGVAIPHGKSKYVSKTCIAILKLKNPIEWETADGKPVSVLVMFAVNEQDKSKYFLKLMAQVARRLAQNGVCERLLSCQTNQELIDTLS